MSGAGAAGAGAAAAQIAMAVRASGAIVRVEPEDFQAILRKQKNPLVVHADARLATRRHRYLTSYKGFTFFTKSAEPLALPAGSERVNAQKIWIP